MTYAFAFLLIFSCSCTMAQSPLVRESKHQTRNFKDKNGFRQGYWKFAISDHMGHGSNTVEGFYYNDKEIGVWTKKDRDGKVYQERIYYDTTRSKVQVNDYYLNGNLKSMGFLFPAPYRDTVMQYDEKLGRDRRVIIDSMLMKSGRWYFYHSNGILESEGLYEKNAKKDIWKFYNQHGELTRTEDL